MYAMGKLPPSLPNFNHRTIITNKNIARIIFPCLNTTVFPLSKCKTLILFKSDHKEIKLG